jgi:hypothetical protein
MIAYVVVIGFNTTELLYLTPILDGQNFIAINVENISGLLISDDCVQQLYSNQNELSSLELCDESLRRQKHSDYFNEK